MSGNSTGNEGLLDNNAAITKRLFAVGNYSRFVRPNYYRIGVSNNAFTSISAYRATNSTSFAIVAVNSSSATVTQIFNLANFPTVASVTPWVTSGNLSLAPQTAVGVAGQSFTYVLPPLTVTTLSDSNSRLARRRSSRRLPIKSPTREAAWRLPIS